MTNLRYNSNCHDPGGDDLVAPEELCDNRSPGGKAAASTRAHMATTKTGTVTILLNAAARGDRSAQDDLYDRVHQELLIIAQGRLRHEPRLKNKAPDSLVNDVFVKFAGNGPSQWSDRKQFYGYVRRAMWQICVDEIRKNKRRPTPSPLTEWMVALRQDPVEMIALHDALKKLEAINPRPVKVVLMRIIESRSVKETARMLGVGHRTVESDWAYARAWLHRELDGRSTIIDRDKAAEDAPRD